MAGRKKSVQVSAGTAALLREYASEKGLTLDEACDALVLTASRRRAAVTKYSRKPKAPVKPATRRKAA